MFSVFRPSCGPKNGANLRSRSGQRNARTRWVGESGAKAECLACIEKVWTDIRPLSLRIGMDEAGSLISEQAERMLSCKRWS